ncbi:M48 family metalloprotease [Pseudoduganella sp. GCM10020061]|uniref:M48 family metalloprotease n=1 Tax=Pseudoduganella sp. GCM10020061 TaxID=3317345 RepID=UPI0036373049
MSANDLRGLFGAGKDMVKAATLTDAEIMESSRLAVRQMDQEAPMAAAGSKYAKRLAKLTAGLQNEDGLQLNFAVYESPDVNAFATPDGSIRVFSGLMDMMTDDELRGVIGHEIGHAKLGHSKSQMQKALVMSGAAKAAAATGNKYAANADTIKKLLQAQFSQADEMASDDYGFDFLKKHKHDVRAMASAFNKLAQLDAGRSNPLTSSHPDPARRAERMLARAGAR